MNYGYQDYTWGDLLTDVDGDHIEYDAIGNPVKIGHYDKSSDEWSDGYELTWNGRQLISYQYFEYYGEDDYYYGTTIEYTYNADGIRTSKTVDGIRHDYVLNGSQIISEIWKSGNTEHLLYYVYDENGLPIGLKYRTSAYEAGVFDCFFFEKNLQGDIIGVYNSTGKRIGTYTYDAWGNFNYSLASGNTALETRIVFRLNPFRYRGYYYDYETGFYYLQSRYYNPEWGRFLNADGYVSTGTGMLGYNMFAYCNNNPVMNVDPNGEFFISITVLCIAAFATVGAIGGGIVAYNGAKNSGVDDDELWKYAAGGAIAGGLIGGIAGYVAAPAIASATGIAGISVTSAGVSVVGAGGIAAEQAAEGVYYQVTSHQAAQNIAQTGNLIPSSTEHSVCVLNFQPTLEQAKQIGAYAYDTVVRFQTNCTTFIRDETVAFEGALRNLRDGAIKVFDVVEVGFK